MHIMIDTGSSISFINETTRMAIPSLRKRPLKSTFFLSKSVTGQNLDTLGTVTVNLRLGSLTLQHDMHVIRNVNQGIILGWDFLKKHQVVLNVGKCTCCLYDQTLPMLSKSQLTPVHCTAQITVTTTIPAQCETHCIAQLIPSAVNAGLADGYCGLFVPYLFKLDGIAVARTLTIAENGQTVVRLMNPTNSPFVLQPGMQLGEFTPISSDDVVEHSDVVCNVSTPSTQVSPLQFEGQKGFLSDSQVNELHSLLHEFCDVFSKSPTDFGRTNIVTHKINTDNAIPIQKRAYRTSPKMQEVIQSHVDDMVAKGIVEASHSPWAAPIVMVRKKDGTWRFCVDYRGLNSVTIKDAHPLPRTDDTLDALRGSSIFSTMDLSSGYWQVHLHEADKPKTAFTTGRALYQFPVMPMDLFNAPPTFQHLMQLVLRGLSWKTCLVYLDDIIVYSKSFSEHIQHLREVFQHLRAANLKLKPAKCSFAEPQVTFLGHVVSSAGLQPDGKNIQKVKDWPTPGSPTEIRAFLGLCSYYRRFIHCFAQISEPLHALTQKGKLFVWTETEQKAFNSLRHALTNAPILSYPDFSKEFLLFTDASNTAIGCVLSQLNADNKESVIAYSSHVLTSTEKRWSTYDRELWAIVWSIRHFRQYLMGHSFRIITAHKPLLSLRRMVLDGDPTGRRARWALEIELYDWTIEHRHGHKHANADAMSRRPDEESREILSNTENKSVHLVSISTQTEVTRPYSTSVQPVSSDACFVVEPSNSSFFTLSSIACLGMGSEDIQQAQTADPVLSVVAEWVSNKKRPTYTTLKGTADGLRHFWKEFPRLAFVDSVLCRKVRPPPGDQILQVVVPPALQPKVFENLHGHSLSGHFSAQKTLQHALVRCFWPHMSRDITLWCAQCQACESRRPPTPHLQAPMQNIITSMPFEKIAADLTELPVTQKGNRYVLAVMDYFTKYLNLYAVADQRATTIAKCLFEDYVGQHGVPQSLHTDQGRQFDSDLVKELCSLLGIHKTRTSPYHAMSDGMVERANRSIKDQLAKYLYTKGGEWDDHLKQVEFAYNTSVHSSTKHTPFFLAHGREARLPADFLLGVPIASSRATPGTPNEYAQSMLGRLRSAFTTVADNIQTAGAQQKHYYDRHIRHTSYQPDDLVWVDLPAMSRHKLSPKWTGPYRVLSRLDSPTGDIGVTYKVLDVLDPRSKPKVIHYNRLKPYRSVWSPEPRPVLRTPQSGCSPLTGLSGSRPYIPQDSSVPKSVRPIQRVQERDGILPPVQNELSERSRADLPVEIPCDRPAEGTKTKSGRSVRPPIRYRDY